MIVSMTMWRWEWKFAVNTIWILDRGIAWIFGAAGFPKQIVRYE
jgi:hypothetical protein